MKLIEQLMQLETECVWSEQEYVACARRFKEALEQRALLLEQTDLDSIEADPELLKKWKGIKAGRKAWQ